ncbi:hypothetical protein CHS0354_003085, partial [Potamilus streckersoni]
KQHTLMPMTLNNGLQSPNSWLVYSTASETLGITARKHQHGFDANCEEIQSLLQEKHQSKAYDIQSFANIHYMKNVNCVLSDVYGL